MNRRTLVALEPQTVGGGLTSWLHVVQLGVKLVHGESMRKKEEVKRFSVSLPVDEYDAIQNLAASQRPPVSLNYAVRYAVQLLLDMHANRQLSLPLTETST